MLRLLSLALAFGQVHGGVVARVDSSPNAASSLLERDLESSLPAYKPEEFSDYHKWTPDSTLYEGLPLLEKQVTVDGKQLTYQDFNISALTTEQFKQHYMSIPQFFDSEGKFIPSGDEVESYHASLIALESNPDAGIALPTKHVSKRAFPDACFYDDSLRCSSSCTDYISRGVRQSFNNNVYGYYHYVSDPQCGVGSISRTVSVTHSSGVSIGGSGSIPGFGADNSLLKAASTFLSTFGLTIGHTPDSVTTGISYSGNCGAFNVCFLWERPHFSVDKGVIVTEQIDANSKRTCASPTITPYEVHTMHTDQDAGGASAHGLCYSMAYHGCGGRVVASDSMIPCPNNY
ncbi:hypothetical protein CORC01_13876 [Colletotrichum orchidophilum]|uniref:Uncharacterized protein n=1 Tax=Colletotrichum orchidophilum TaxID=1209926 RepID=A0A1G4AP75_9PEZI|nr:uncharacterized protein CORC01_13876 [Colletotrichum orchidophilum]OHE90832.1 hypothetical protein CORC01_13876 [Colletotrichum orchidophilum]